MENKANSIHLDQRFIIGLVESNSKIIEEIYSDYYPRIQSYILKNNGTIDDAKDMFNDSLRIIYLQGKNDNLILSKSFGAYLHTICKRRWLNTLTRSKKFTRDIENQTELASDENIGDAMIAHEKTLLFRKHFENLANTCKQILKLSIEGLNLREIAETLKLSYAYLRRARGECEKKLISSVKSDPIFNELK